MDPTVDAVQIKEEPLDDVENQGVELPQQTNANEEDFTFPNIDVMAAAVTDDVDFGVPWKIVDENADVITVNLREEFYEDSFPAISATKTEEPAKPKRKRKVYGFVGNCPDCGETLRGRRVYNEHMELGLCATKKNHARCEICNYPFPTQQDLEKHLSLHRMNRFFCVKRCDSDFKTYEEVVDHEFRVHQIKKILCNVCNHKFATGVELINHMNTKHKNLPRYTCSYCREWCINAQELIEHWRMRPEGCGHLMKIMGLSMEMPAKKGRLQATSKILPTPLPTQTEIPGEKPTNDNVEAKQEPVDLDESMAVQPDTESWKADTAIAENVEVKLEPIDLDESMAVPPTNETWEVCVEIGENAEVKQEPIDLDEYMPEEQQSGTGSSESHAETGYTVQVKQEPLDQDECITADQPNGSLQDRIEIKTEPIEADKEMQTEIPMVGVVKSEIPGDAVVKTENPPNVVVKTETDGQQQQFSQIRTIRMPNSLKIVPVSAGQASTMMSSLKVPQNIVIRPVPITNMVSIPRNSLMTSNTTYPLPISGTMPKPLTSTQSLIQYRPVKILRLGSNAKIVRLPPKVEPQIVTPVAQPPKQMAPPQSEPAVKRPTRLMEIVPQEALKRKNWLVQKQIRQSPQAIKSLSVPIMQNPLTAVPQQPKIEAPAQPNLVNEKLPAQLPKVTVRNLEELVEKSGDAPPRAMSNERAANGGELTAEKPVLTVELIEPSKVGKERSLTKLRVSWRSLDEQTYIDAEEFRRMISEAAEKAIDDARQRSLLPSGNDEEPVIKRENSSSDSDGSLDMPLGVPPTTKSSASPTSFTSSNDELSSSKVVSMSHELNLSLNALDASTISKKDKLKSVIANAAEIALREAQRKYSLSRRHISSYESLPDRQKVISQIVEQMKMAENGIPSYKWDELQSAKRRNTQTTSDENLMIFEGSPRKMYLAPRRLPPSDDSQNARTLAELMPVEPTSESNVQTQPLMFPMSTSNDPELLKLRRKNPDNRYVWLCPNCPRRYEQKHSFRAHLVNAHAFGPSDLATMMVEVKPMKCPTAVRNTESSSVLVEKKAESATAITLPSFTPVDTKPASSMPVEETRTVAKPKFECHKCGRQCSSKAMLADHIRGNCSREPQYPCHLCSKRYFSASTLSCHLTVHTGELPHKCNYCDKRFRTRGQVTVHHRTHTGERPFVCQVCTHSFTHRETLISHLSRHIGMKRYKCYGCDKLFSCISGLRTHRAIRPDTCGKVKFNSRAVGPRVRVIRGNVVFEPQPVINPYLRTEDPQEVLAEIQNQQKS